MLMKDLLYGIFDEGTEEYELIDNCYQLISKTAPVTMSEAKNQMYLLDHARANISTLYFLVSRNLSQYKEAYGPNYDSKYTRLVKLGRPSNAAIESEIRSTDPDYAVAALKMESLEEIKNLLSSYIRCIDECKKTAVEIFRNSNRID